MRPHRPLSAGKACESTQIDVSTHVRIFPQILAD